jgi:hypothetical protein
MIQVGGITVVMNVIRSLILCTIKKTVEGATIVLLYKKDDKTDCSN